MPVQRVEEGVFLVGGAGLSGPGDCCVYLVDTGDGGSVLIDAGLSTAPGAIFRNVEGTGHRVEDIEALVLTHCHIDHIGGAPALVERSGCQVVAHEGDAQAISEGIASRTAADAYGVPSPEIHVDRVITSDGGLLEYGSAHLVVVHTPGHTPGDISVKIEAGERTLLAANDVHGPFSRAWGSNIETWRRSMNRLIAIGPDVLLEGHYGVIEPRRAALEFIKGMLEQDMRML
jgi:glyoxylase-like metal-dependent hydrolase (beta-lactamase superfamily II)